MKDQHIFKLVSQKFFVIALTFFLFLGGSNILNAQNSRIEAIHSKRIAFLTNRISLTPEEASQFWPVYNEYNQKRDEQANVHSKKWSGKLVSEMSQEEANKYAENQVRYQEASATLKREYYEKFKKILPIKKIALLFEAERDFNKILFQEARRRGRDDRGSGL